MGSSRFKLKRRNAAPGGAGSTTLNALTLLASTAQSGVSGSTTILGRTLGSTLTLTNNVGGVFSINSATGMLSWTSSLASGANTPTIREVLAGATNTPRDSSPTLTGVVGLVLNDPAANGSPYTIYQPVYRDAFLVMPAVVDQGDEAVDVQAVCGVPYSPLATKVTFTGSDTQWFDIAAGGKLIYKAATRASVPKDQWLVLATQAENANGLSEPSTTWIWSPADADCVFVSPTGDDTTGTGSKTAPFKHCPKTTDWTGPGGAGNPTYAAGKCVIFEGGDHLTSLVSGGATTYPAPPHSSTNAARPVRYCFHSWRGQARFSGADQIPGSWTSAVAADVYGNGNHANVTKVTLSTAMERFQPIFWGRTVGHVAQYPRPNNLWKNEDPQSAGAGTNNYNDTLGTSDGGFKKALITANASDTTPVRIWISTDGSSSYIQDAKLDAIFNNQSVSYNSAGIGPWLKIWGGGNNVYYTNALAYDVTTHRVTFNGGPASDIASNRYPTPDGFSAYAICNSPWSVQVAGQYAYSNDGLAVIAHRPASPGQAFISKRHVGSGIGPQNVAMHQGWFERYSGSNSSRATPSEDTQNLGGHAIRAYNTGNNTGIQIYGCRAHQNNSENEDPAGLYVSGVTGLDNPILDRFHHTENIRGGGSKCAAPMSGKTTGSGPAGFPTMAEVLAHPTGKKRWWYNEEDGITRTADYWMYVRGFECRENVTRNFSTVHGDGYAWYRDTNGQYGDHNVIIRDFADNMIRWMSTSDGASETDHSVSRSNWYLQCVVLGGVVGSNAGLTLSSGMPGALFQQSICVLTPSAAATYPCMDIFEGFANLTVQNCILNGVVARTAPSGGVPATYTFDGCGFTGNSIINGASGINLPADDAANSRRFTNNTRLTNANSWDGTTIPSAWQTILQKGATPGTVPIGPFWKV